MIPTVREKKEVFVTKYDTQRMKSIAEYDIFNKRMTIKEAKEYINEEVDYYTIVDVKPIYNLGFLTK